MLSSAAIAFVVIYVLESVLIIFGNTFTIFVFWTQKLHHKRTCFLLINLAVADLLVGITIPIVLGTEMIPNMKTIRRQEKDRKNPLTELQLFASSTSVLFLALISLERVFSVLWPIRHRVLNTRAYIYSIAIVWAVGICMGGLSVLSMYYTKVDRAYVFVAIHTCLFISFLMICASYLKIRNRLHCTTDETEVHNRQSTEHNLRLSRTIFIVIAVSLLFWLPAFVVYITKSFCPRCFAPPVVSFVNVLHLANSMVNPFVYTFRMPIFKDAMKKISQKRRRNIQIAPAQARRLVLSWEGSASPQMEHSQALDINLASLRDINDGGQSEKVSVHANSQLDLYKGNEADGRRNPHP